MNSPAAGAPAAGPGRRALFVAVVLAALALLVLPHCLDDEPVATAAGDVVAATDVLATTDVLAAAGFPVSAGLLAAPDGCHQAAPVAVAASKTGTTPASATATADRTTAPDTRCPPPAPAERDGAGLHELGSLRI
ncbi:hypothetical protein [Cryptosporangium sp. NPDC051539]|uniref:hypothetical protein n=1 Tax=Cryptosporangium sp. NPDC051539 TaxID=3363962 RepID=UPI0037900DCB